MRGFVRLNGWVDRHFTLVLIACGAAIAATLVRRAVVTPFWHDEIYTIVASRLSLPSLWAASRDGLDLAPPFNTALTHVVHAVAGVGPVATRVPPLIGFLIAFACVGVAVRRLTNALIGVAAALMLCHTGAYMFAVEARGYGVVTGCFAIALCSWLSYAEGRGGRWVLAALALSLGAGLWTHYYFVFAFLPIFCGEAVRQYRLRRLDLQMWAAIAFAMVLASPLVILLRDTLGHAPTFWTKLQHIEARPTYEALMATLVGSRFRVVAAIVALFLLIEAVRRFPRGSGRALPAHVMAMGLACLVIPAIAVLFARTIGHDVFAPRYVMFATAGLVVVLSLLIWRLGPSSGLVDLVVFSVLAFFLVRTVWRTFEPGRLVFKDPMAQYSALVSRINAGDRVVVTGGTRFIEMWYHTPSEQRQRIVYLADPVSELAEAGTDAVDRGFLSLSRWSDVPVQDARVFLATHQDFTLYESGDFWLGARLRSLGATLEEIGIDAKGFMYRVRMGVEK